MNLTEYTCKKCGEELNDNTAMIFWQNHKSISDVYDYLKVWDLEFMPNTQRRFEDFRVWCQNNQ